MASKEPTSSVHHSPFGKILGPSVALDSVASAEIDQKFKEFDADKSGQITTEELEKDLKKDTEPSFNRESVHLMIGMFASQKHVAVNKQEFGNLWVYIQAWKSFYKTMDSEEAKQIDKDKLHQLLTSFGFKVSPEFCTLAVGTFDLENTNVITFTELIQIAALLKSLTHAFSKKDKSNTGLIKIKYEEFLRMGIDHSLH